MEELASGQPWSVVSKGVGLELPSKLSNYLRTFKDWKLVDERKLTGRIKKALKGLEDAERVLMEEDEGSNIMLELRAQMVRLREKLTQLGGEAAVTLHDNERRLRQSVTVVKTGAGGEAPKGAPASVGGMTNAQLAHELLLDRNFVLDEKVGAQLIHRFFNVQYWLDSLPLVPCLQSGMSEDKLVHTEIRATFEKSFWDSLKEDLSGEVPRYGRVLSVLTEITNGIEVDIVLV